MAGVKRRVLIECGVAETRSAFLLGDETIRFWFNPARGDEALPRPPQTGDIYLGRVRSVSKSLGGAFVDLGGDRDGFLPVGGSGQLPAEGAALIVRVRRPVSGAKGAVLSVDWKAGLKKEGVAFHEAQAAQASAPAPLGDWVDPAIHAFVFAAPDAAVEAAEEIVVNDVAAAKLVQDYAVNQVSIEDNPFETYGATEALERSLERVIRLSGGARLAFDEAEAMTVVDIDSGGAADGASGRLNDKVNIAAAKALPAEFSRRGVGGRIVVDFLPPSGAEARKKLTEILIQASRGVFEMRLGKLSADGVYDMTAPRTQLSLLERATEQAGDGWPVPGRRFTLDWAAKSAIGALEGALATRPSARPRLIVGASIEAYLRTKRPQWAGRLAARYGARFTIAPDDKLEERSFDLAE